MFKMPLFLFLFLYVCLYYILHSMAYIQHGGTINTVTERKTTSRAAVAGGSHIMRSTIQLQGGMLPRACAASRKSDIHTIVCTTAWQQEQQNRTNSRTEQHLIVARVVNIVQTYSFGHDMPLRLDIRHQHISMQMPCRARDRHRRLASSLLLPIISRHRVHRESCR